MQHSTNPICNLKSHIVSAIICLVLVCAFQTELVAQRGNNWCFGDSAGIDFNTSPPTTFITSVKSRGSCSSISDSTGRLLFYYGYNANAVLTGQNVHKNGEIYSASNQLMQNGDSIVTATWYFEGVIVPKPSTNFEYYLFSLGVTGNYGLYYSIIDVAQNNGQGKVVQKNVQLLNSKSIDCVTVIRYGNGRDWWLLYKYYGNLNNTFSIYLISPSGINGPFLQNIGVPTSNGFIRSVFNNQGNKMALINYLGMIELFDFDRCTGQFSNWKLIDSNKTSSQIPGFWSAEFSPDDSKLYVSNDGQIINLLQYNLLDSVPNSTVDTIAQFSFPLYSTGMLKLAPDNKIYWSRSYYDGLHFNYPYPDTTYNMYNMNLSVINSPDSLGAACDFTSYSFYLGGTRTYLGLPNNPNYDLGPLAGSICDTLSVGLNEIPVYKNNLAVYYDAGWQMAFVNAKGLKGKNAVLKLFNLNGQLITSLKGTSSGEYFTADVNMQGLTNGMYIFQLSTDREVLTGKVIK